MEAISKTVLVRGNSAVIFTCEQAGCEVAGIKVEGGALVRAYTGSSAKPVDLIKGKKFTPRRWPEGERLTAIVCQKGGDAAPVTVTLGIIGAGADA